jgi:SAM-dependent methyltransferase
MSQLSAWWFSQVQAAHFYIEVHKQAVALLGPGQGQTWFDIGCGPGLVTRLAKASGHQAQGFDLDPAMVVQARRLAGPQGPRFEASALDQTRHGQADVVSAASLLQVLPDRAAGLRQLLAAVAPGGRLLVVETSARMAQASADWWQPGLATGRGAWILRVWARVRRGRPAVDVAALCPPGYSVQAHPLLGGLVTAWIVQRCDAQPATV